MVRVLEHPEQACSAPGSNSYSVPEMLSVEIFFQSSLKAVRVCLSLVSELSTGSRSDGPWSW